MSADRSHMVAKFPELPQPVMPGWLPDDVRAKLTTVEWPKTGAVAAAFAIALANAGYAVAPGIMIRTKAGTQPEPIRRGPWGAGPLDFPRIRVDEIPARFVGQTECLFRVVCGEEKRVLWVDRRAYALRTYVATRRTAAAYHAPIVSIAR